MRIPGSVDGGGILVGAGCCPGGTDCGVVVPGGLDDGVVVPGGLDGGVVVPGGRVGGAPVPGGRLGGGPVPGCPGIIGSGKVVHPPALAGIDPHADILPLDHTLSPHPRTKRTYLRACGVIADCVQ